MANVSEKASYSCPFRSSDVLAIVLNWNDLEVTRLCINSLLCQKEADLDILIIDNHSDFDPCHSLRLEFPDITIIRHPENIGVAGGRNIGIKYAINQAYPFVLFFDNDAYADPRMLVNLMESASLNPNAGIFGPKIFKEGSINVIWRAGCTSWKWTYLHAGYEILNQIFQVINKPLPSFFDTKRGEDQTDTGQYDKACDIDFQIGCAQFIRTNLFSKIGLIDEEFSPYGAEDIEFCDRATQAGFRIRYVPEAICWHRIASSFRDQYKRTYYNSRHFILLARKRLTNFYFWFLFIPDFVLLTVPLMLLRTFIRKEPERRKAFIDAIIWNYQDAKKRGVLLTKKMMIFHFLPST